MRGLLVAAVLCGAASAPALGGAWVQATVGPDGATRLGHAPGADDWFPCTGFAPLTADCDSGAHLSPLALTLGWPACDDGPASTPMSNCFAGDMLDVLTYQEPEARQLVFKCTAIYAGVAGKVYDYACFTFGPWLFDVPFEHTCAMRAYGTTVAGPAPLEPYPRGGAPGAVGAWLCGVTTFAGWS